MSRQRRDWAVEMILLILSVAFGAVFGLTGIIGLLIGWFGLVLIRFVGVVIGNFSDSDGSDYYSRIYGPDGYGYYDRNGHHHDV